MTYISKTGALSLSFKGTDRILVGLEFNTQTSEHIYRSVNSVQKYQSIRAGEKPLK